tara:strand:- start:842 stop:1012 length:171 start_codon:yes stop_codon:yes gene_type:complete
MDTKETKPKTKLINLRVSDEELMRWAKALEISGKSKTEICRNALNRHALRIERTAQ